MFATLYCDGSFDPRCGKGGWAVWIRSNQGKLVKSGPTPDYISTSVHAELSAVYAGLYLTLTTWSNVEQVLVCTDCTAVVDYLSGKPTKKAPDAPSQRLLSKIADLVDQKGVEVNTRWVPGHQTTKTTRTFVNNVCDRLAKTELRKQRPSKPKPKVLCLHDLDPAKCPICKFMRTCSHMFVGGLCVRCRTPDPSSPKKQPPPPPAPKKKH